LRETRRAPAQIYRQWRHELLLWLIQCDWSFLTKLTVSLYEVHSQRMRSNDWKLTSTSQGTISVAVEEAALKRVDE
jgi:hypothetical protein